MKTDHSILSKKIFGTPMSGIAFLLLGLMISDFLRLLSNVERTWRNSIPCEGTLIVMFILFHFGVRRLEKMELKTTPGVEQK